MALLGQLGHGIAMQFQAFVFKDIKLVSALVADPEGQEFVRRFHENKLHAALKELKMEQAGEMRQEYLAGKSIGKNVLLLTSLVALNCSSWFSWYRENLYTCYCVVSSIPMCRSTLGKLLCT
jgi:hypothetical protein